jgi:hypothetical protein
MFSSYTHYQAQAKRDGTWILYQMLRHIGTHLKTRQGLQTGRYA